MRSQSTTKVEENPERAVAAADDDDAPAAGAHWGGGGVVAGEKIMRLMCSLAPWPLRGLRYYS